ncbi:hypothetical protein [Hyphomicrobium sp. DY-1]|uniref:hypothetical protein n=1 Tax=Hyphomicrobium sp. DY-1 TaxID=3075650 RepID=UPI0039C49AD9
MITRVTQRQVTHVLAGRNVTGRPYGAPIAFPDSPMKLLKLQAWIGTAFDKDGPRLTVAQRTALIRKLAHYMIRTGKFDALRAASAVNHLRAHPELLTTRLSFAGAIAVAEDQQRHIANQHNKARRRDVLKDSADTPYAPPPVVHVDGPFVFEQLIHPRHLADAGTEAGNCLAVDKHVLPIANPLYWTSINRKGACLYAVRRDGSLRMVFLVAANRVTEAAILSPDPDLKGAFSRSLAALAPAATPIAPPRRLSRRAPRPNPPSEPPRISFTDIAPALNGHIPGGPDFKPLAFPTTTAARDLLMNAMTDFARLAPYHTLDDRLRFARKVAVYLVRHPKPEDGFALVRGTAYFAQHRAALRTRLSFAGAARLNGLMWRQFDNRQDKVAFTRLKRLMAAPCCQPLVLLEKDGFRLTMLTHPRHLADLGGVADTPFVIRRGRQWYPQPRMWGQAHTGHRRFFTLWRGDKLCVAFTTMFSTLSEMHTFVPHDILSSILADCVPAVEAITGHLNPLRNDLWPRPESESLRFEPSGQPPNWIHPKHRNAPPCGARENSPPTSSSASGSTPEEDEA